MKNFTIKRVLVAAFLLFALISGLGHLAEPELNLAQSTPLTTLRAVALLTASDGSNCTAFVVRPRLAVTASHCVPVGPGEQVTLLFYSPGELDVKGTVIWDGFFVSPDVDIALIALEQSRAAVLPLGTAIPFFTQIVQTVQATGIRLQSHDARFIATINNSEVGALFVYLGPMTAGASGSPVLLDGRVIGTLNYYTPSTVFPTIWFGITGERLREALADYDEKGSMPR